MKRRVGDGTGAFAHYTRLPVCEQAQDTLATSSVRRNAIPIHSVPPAPKIIWLRNAADFAVVPDTSATIATAIRLPSVGEIQVR